MAALDRALLALIERWQIDRDTADAILAFDSDRVRLLLDTYEGVFALLRNPEAERAWIKEPRAGLDGQSVLTLMEGSLADMGRAARFVDAANGR